MIAYYIVSSNIHYEEPVRLYSHNRYYSQYHYPSSYPYYHHVHHYYHHSLNHFQKAHSPVPFKAKQTDHTHHTDSRTAIGRRVS